MNSKNSIFDCSSREADVVELASVADSTRLEHGIPDMLCSTFKRTKVYSKEPALKYRFVLRHCPSIYYLRKKQFNLMTSETTLFCSATGGLISIDVSNKQTIITIESTLFKSFTVLFACLRDITYGIAIEVKVTSEGELSVAQIKNNNIYSHKYFPSKYYHEAVCVFGIKKYACQSVYDALIDVEKFPQDISHTSIKDSVFGDAPNLHVRCTRCLVYSFDGKNHTPPCTPINTVSRSRYLILAKQCAPMFKIRLQNENQVFFLNHLGHFQSQQNSSKLLSPATDGVFTFSSSENFNSITYEASQFHRFSVIFAIFMDGLWRLRLVAVPTLRHGLMLFPMRSTLSKVDGGYFIPPGYILNNVLVVGIKPTQVNGLKIDFKVFANNEGIINENPFNGYYVHSTFNEDEDRFDLFGEFKAEKFFSRNITIKDPLPLIGLRDQQIDTDMV